MQTKVIHHVRTRLRIMFRDLVINGFGASVLMPRTLRRLLYRAYGMKIETKNISPRCFFGGAAIRIGVGTFVNYKCFFEGAVEIGQDCAIGMEALFCNSTHLIGSPRRRAGEVVSKPIRVGNGCWIGTRAVILPGVSIGDGCIIAAGAVVVNDCESNGLYAGVPARRIRELIQESQE